MVQKLLLYSILFTILTGNNAVAQDCSIPYLPSQFKARLAWRSSQNNTSTAATPVVANLNPQEDSLPEIIVCGGNGQMNWDKLQFYRGDGTNATNPFVLTVQGSFDYYPAPTPIIGDVNNDGIPELLISCADNRIRVYNNYTENPVAPMSLWIVSTGALDGDDIKLSLADFDSDGIPEVYAGSDIFKFDFTNPANPVLAKILNGPADRGQSSFSLYSELACNPTAVDMLTVAECNGDPDCGGLELVAGTKIYSVDVDLNDGDGYQIKVQRDLATMVPPVEGYRDGYTAVADVNLDGVLDIIVTGVRHTNQFGMYIWNKNGLIRWFSYPNNSSNSGSLACIANVFDDTKMGFATDFPEILICSSGNFTCYNLHATPYWWSLPTTDFSGWTGSTVYDFNGDGISEIVYRDETDLRILYGGSAPFPTGVDAQRNWFKTPCFSGTSDEYPVVADLDNDGETEIVVTGRATAPPPAAANERFKGRLNVYESDATPWVPCRNVWNQYNYFIVNINDDLSIPATQQLHHLELPAPGSGIRPFNTYLSQRPLLNDNFQPYIPLPDVSGSVQQFVCNGDSVTVQVNICNFGEKNLPANTPVAFYQSDPTTTTAALFGTVQWTNAIVQKDSCRNFFFTLPRTAGNFYGVVNDDASEPTPFQLALDFPVTDQLECNYLNNIFQFLLPDVPPPFDLGPDLGACKDTSVLLSAGAGFESYLWQDGSTGQSLQAQQAGVFWVEATDFCAQKQRDTVFVTLYDKPLIQLDVINGDCFGSPASATVSAQSAHLPLGYVWSTGDQILTISGLPDGLYTVTVTNGKGCTSTSETWVEAGGQVQASATITAPILCFGQNGALGLTMLTGNPPYTFQWSDGSQTQNLAQAPAGNYLVTITDADHCSDTVQIAITQPDALLSSGFSANPSCPGLSTGEASFLGALQGTAPYQLLWSNNATGPYLAGLSSGNYQLTITDANGCSITDAVQVPEFAAPGVASTETDVSCFGANDGKLAISVLNGTPGFGFLWSNSATTSQVNGLPPGNYTLTLTYANGSCAEQFAFQIDEPLPITLSAVSAPAICNGGLGGNIDLSVQNGVPPLGYLWSNSAVSEDLNNVAAGPYQVTVTDANGCTQALSQAVGSLPPITLSASTQSPLCAGGTDGGVLLNTGGGTGSYQYAWSNGSSGAALSQVSAGAYTVTVTDAAACTQVISVQVTEPTALLSAGLASAPACPGEANGNATFLGASQGTPPYSLLWSTNSANPAIQGLSAGTYQLTLTDAHACSKVESVQVGEHSAPVAQASVADVRCFGETNGSISLQITGGTPGFGYQWSNSATTASVQNLAPGNYALTLTYANGFCAQTFDYQIIEPPILALFDTVVTPVKCFGGNNGAIDLSAQGGIAPYGYQWSSSQSAEDLANLPAGNYALTLTDKNGCTIAAQFEVPQPPALTLATMVGADTCQSSNGLVDVALQGGVQPYQYHWSNAASTSNQMGLPAGTYQLTVTDANNCTATRVFDVLKYGEIPQLSTYSDTLTCAQPVVQIGVTANQSNLHFSWLAPGGSLADQASHAVQTAGVYQVTVVNAFGCQSEAQLQVLENTAAPIAEAGPPSLEVQCDETMALLNASGSTQGNGYLNRWTGYPNGAASFDTLSILLPVFEGGLYVHSVLNLSNGCSATDSIQVNWNDPIAAEIALDPIRCFGDRDGQITLEDVSGGNAPFSYSINNQSFTSQNSFNNLSPGTYLLRIRDNFGCAWERTVVLTEPEAISVELSASDTALYLGQTVQLNAEAFTNGLSLSAIDWLPDGFPYTSMSLQQRVRPETGTEFAVRITDQNGCIAEDRIWVSVYNHHIYVPNVILPGSETNSWFTVFAGDGVPEVRLLRVYDRWGEQVFERTNFLPNAPELGWDGAFRGQPMNPGVFAWYAEVLLFDGRVVFLKGDVTVLR